MTLDLLFIGADTGRGALSQFAAEVGVSYRLIAQRITTMEIFPVSVLTVELDADATGLDAAASWFARRGIHQLTPAA
ncbi:hypothetical protein [Brooklawnia sp.]|uniref:hypothetical protein n=1 Tax=Brooklawnia sp. TaxID=2699740 RepID=UPI00311F910B